MKKGINLLKTQKRLIHLEIFFNKIKGGNDYCTAFNFL